MSAEAAIERAFELARSGQYRSVSEVIRRLLPEDRESVEAHLAKPNARRELILVCSEAWLATQ
jgi:Arc/MetJ-type ribon-helix-helix transcriptional regulator